MVEISEIFFNSYGLLWSFVGLICLFTITWLISIPLKNVGLVDIIWGLSFGLQALIHYFFYGNYFNPVWQTIVFTGLVLLHGLRLTIYLLIRNCGKPEDKRYTLIFRNKIGEKFWWISYFAVFLPQLILSFIIGFLIFSFNTIKDENSINIPAFLVGVCIMFIGTLYESIADQQLYYFKNNQKNKGKVLNNGLWYYSRHPNYFGETVFWIGVYIVNLSAVIYYTIFSVVIMIYLVNCLSGTPITEKNISSEKSEDYKKYIRTTSVLIPWCKIKYKEEVNNINVDENVNKNNMEMENKE